MKSSFIESPCFKQRRIICCKSPP